MAVSFILGRAASGKTHHCFDAVEEWILRHGLKTKVFFLAPHQATFMVERQLLARRPGRAVLGVRVVSFDTLAREIAGEGVSPSAILSARGRALLIAMAVQKSAAELTYFRDAENQPHLPGRIDAAFNEIDQAGVSVQQLAEKCDADDSATQAKLHDLGLIRDAYARLLTSGRLDGQRQRERLVSAISTSELLRDALVVVDGFASFSRVQRDILLALAKRVTRMDVAILLDKPGSGSDETDLFHRTGRTLWQLEREFAAAGIPHQRVMLAPEGRRFANPGLRALEQAFAGDTVARQENGRITLIEATSDLEEVKAAARQIRSWLISGIDGKPVRLRDIGVICRNLSTYQPWIAPVFAEHSIPCFVDQRRSLTNHPLIRFLRSALDIATTNWKQSLVLDYLKCGLAALTQDELDRLENFVLRHGITGEGFLTSWDFLSSPAAEDETRDEKRERADSQACSEYRTRAFEPLLKITRLAERGELVVAEMIEVLREIIAGGASHIAATMARWISESATAEAQEHEQCVKEVLELLASVRDLLGQQKLMLGQIASILLASLESMEAKLRPPTLDQVLIGQIDRSRSPEFRAVILLGMNDGTFPAGFSEDSIFSDAERKSLRSRGIELEADSKQRILDERLMAYIAVTRASHELVLSRAIADEDGRERTESAIVTRVRAVLPVEVISAGKGDLMEAATPAQLAGLVASRRRESAHADALTLKAMAWMKSAAAPAEVREAWEKVSSALSYENRPTLTPEIAAELSGETLSCSVTRLERFTACPFRHFAADSLGLEQREIAEVSDLDLGNAFHSVLDGLSRQIINERLNWSKEALRERLDGMLSGVAKELRNEVLLSSARNGYLMSVIRRMLDRVVNDQQILEKAGTYRLYATEMSFGHRDDSLKPLVLQTPGSRRVQLRGRIDRIDRNTGDRRESYLIFDYKRHSKKLDLRDAEKGLTLQLLSYLLVLRENQMNAQGALYVTLMRGLKTEKTAPTGQREENCVEAKPRGIFSLDALEAMEPNLSGRSNLYAAGFKNDGCLIAKTDCVPATDLDDILESLQLMLGKIADEIFSGKIDVSPYQIGNRSPCPHCDYRAVCRMDVTTNSYRDPQPIVPLVRAPAAPPKAPKATRKKTGEASHA